MTLLQHHPNTACNPNFDANPPHENLATCHTNAARKSCHGANPLHTSPATVCKPHHDPNLPRKNLATSTQHASPTTPTHCAQAPPQCHPPQRHAKAPPPTRCNPTLRRIAATAHFL